MVLPGPRLRLRPGHRPLSAVPAQALTPDRDEETLRAAYRAFNERDVEAALSLMHPEVDWPNAWEGGRVRGREAVAAYWARQFEQISSRVEPRGFSREEDGTIAVDVHQIVRDADTGEVVSDSRVVHRWRFEDGLVVRMDVVEPEAGDVPAA